MKHSVFSPSAMGRGFSCPASILKIHNHRLKHPNKDNSQSQRGTRIHDLGEKLLLNKVISPNVDNEELSDAKLYAQYCRSLNCVSFDVEKRYDLSDLEPTMFGTGDFGGIDKEEVIHIVDLKTGYINVLAEENEQLMLYGWGALKNYHKAESIKLHIFQVNDRVGVTISTFELDIWELVLFIETVAKPSIENAKSDNPVFNPTPTNCQWCDYATNCNSLYEKTELEVQNMFDDVSEINDFGDVPNGKLNDLLVRLDEVCSFGKIITNVIFEKLNRGEEVLGFKLVLTKPHRKFVQSEEFLRVLKRYFKVNEVQPRKTLTVAQMKKQLTDKEWDKLIPFIDQPRGVAVLAKDTDKRPTHSPVTFDDVTPIN